LFGYSAIEEHSRRLATVAALAMPEADEWVCSCAATRKGQVRRVLRRTSEGSWAAGFPKRIAPESRCPKLGKKTKRQADTAYFRATWIILRDDYRCGGRMVDQTAGDRSPLSSLALPDMALPRLLELYASYCFSLAEKCEQRRTARWLRLLSVDLVTEADQCRRQFAGRSERPQAGLAARIGNHRNLSDRNTSRPLTRRTGF
jgi:hypothetical protein